MKIKINSDDNPTLTEALKLHNLKKLLDLFFEKSTDIIHKLFRWMFVWVINMLQYETMKELMFQKELTLINKIDQKNAWLIIIDILKK